MSVLTKIQRQRLLGWLIAAVVLLIVIALTSPQQLGVTLYKLSLVSLAAVLGYHLDRGLFPYASPGGYLRHNWKVTDAHQGPDQPEYPIVPGFEMVFAAVLLRRAVIVLAVVLGVTLGL